MSDKTDRPVAELTLEVLREIRSEARETNSRLTSLEGEMRRGFDGVNRRIDNLLLGEHREEHESLRGRVDRIERHLGLDSG